MDRPYNTLFLCQSLDGKISTGVGIDMDIDKHFANDERLKEAMDDYYAYEKTTEYYSMITGKIAEKMGANEETWLNSKRQICQIIVDNGHLHPSGLHHICEYTKEVILITTDRYIGKDGRVTPPNCRIIHVFSIGEVKTIMTELNVRGVDRVTVQTGGTYNSMLLRSGMIDEVVIYLLPVIIGGAKTPTLVDGDSFQTYEELSQLCYLNLVDVVRAHGGALRLRYNVVNNDELIAQHKKPYQSTVVPKGTRDVNGALDKIIHGMVEDINGL